MKDIKFFLKKKRSKAKKNSRKLNKFSEVEEEKRCKKRKKKLPDYRKNYYLANRK